MKTLSSISGQFGYDPVNNTPTFALSLGSIPQPEVTLEEIFQYLDSLDKPCGKNPTPNHNKYLVLNLNFAVVNADLGNYRNTLDAHCNTHFNSFCDQYASYLRYTSRHKVYVVYRGVEMVACEEIEDYKII